LNCLLYLTESFEKGCESLVRIYCCKELVEELVLVLANVKQEGTPGADEAAVIALVLDREVGDGRADTGKEELPATVEICVLNILKGGLVLLKSDKNGRFKITFPIL
jgi:hypothetical protein